MKAYKIKVPIYQSEVRVVYSKDMAAVTNKYNLRPGANKYDAFCFRKGDHIYVIFQNKAPHIIAHECVHLVNMIFDDVFVELDLKNDEAQAYLTGYLFKKICKFLKKNN